MTLEKRANMDCILLINCFPYESYMVIVLNKNVIITRNVLKKNKDYSK